MTTTGPTAGPFDKFNAGEDTTAGRRDWRDRLYRRAAHKSLDIPDDSGADDMQIAVDNSGAKTRDIAAVAALITAAGAGGFFLADRNTTGPAPPPAVVTDPHPPPLPAPPPAAPVHAHDIDTKNTIRFLN